MFKIKFKLAGEDLVSFNAPSLPPPEEEYAAPAYDEEAAERKRRKRERRERERAAAAAAEAAYGDGGGLEPLYLKPKAPRQAAYGSGFGASGSELGGATGHKSQLQLLLDMQRSQQFGGAETQAPPGGFGSFSAPFGSFGAPKGSRKREREREQHAPFAKQPSEALRRPPPRRSADADQDGGELMHHQGRRRGMLTLSAPVPSVVRSARVGGPDQPKRHLLEAAVAKLSKVDREGFFQDPVTDAIAPGYSSVVARPMDFTTIRLKMRADAYGSWDELSEDVALIVSNCLLYNAAGTVFTAAAERLKEAAEPIIKGYKENGGRPKPAETRRMPPPPAPPKPRQLRPPQAPMQLVPSEPSRPPAAPRPQPAAGNAAPSRPAQPRPAPAPAKPAPPRPAAVIGDGRRGLSDDENRRGTFRPRGFHSRMLTVHGELALNAYTATAAPQGAAPPQLGFRTAPGPFAPDGYARSIARFAALLGPRARRMAMQRAAEAIDPLPAKLPVLPAYPAKPQAARPVGAAAR